MAERGSILIVGGYGEVGRRIAAHLAPDYPDRIIIAGRNPLRASSLADRVGHGVRPMRLDIDDRAAIGAAIKGVSLLVACVRQREPHLLRAAIEHGLAYTDIAPFGIWREAVALRATAQAKEARIVLGAGLVPGISSVLARAAAERLGEIDVLHTSLLLATGDAFGPDALDYLLSEITRSFVVVEDGHERSVRSFTDGRRVRFPAPIGSRVAYRAPFTDQLSYPETLGARTAACRLTLDPPWVTALVAALVRSRVVYLTDRPGLRPALKRLIVTLQRAYAGRDRYALVVEAGNRSGGSLRLSVTGHNQSEGTAIGATLIAAALDRGEVDCPGVWFPEQVIAVDPFFAGLSAQGLAVVAGGAEGAA
jgi:saccharopine dehydrogenase-like NADP-dependent oxidoreductase